MRSGRGRGRKAGGFASFRGRRGGRGRGSRGRGRKSGRRDRNQGYYHLDSNSGTTKRAMENESGRDKPSMHTPRTRLCVKNIPEHLTEERFRTIFEEYGPVTDVRILRTPDGSRSRKFGFVGFADANAAKAAKGARHKSFIDTSRIQIEYALRPGDEKLPQAWSKYSKGSNEHRKHNPEHLEKPIGKSEIGKRKDAKSGKRKNKKNRMNILRVLETHLGGRGEKLENDPKFVEFLHIMGGAGKSKFWANDDDGGAERAVAEFQKWSAQATNNSNFTVGGAKAKATTSLVPNKKRGGEGMMISKTHVKFEYDEESKEESGGTGSMDMEEGEETEAASGHQITNPLQWLKQKVDPTLDKIVKDDDTEDDESEDHNSDDDDDVSSRNKYQKSKENAGIEEDVLVSGRLFVRNLPYSLTEEGLEAHFAKFGEIADVHMPLDLAKKPKGFAFVSYVVGEDAARALEALDQTIFQGRLIHILPARKLKKEEPEEGDSRQQFKDGREKERREKAAKGEDLGASSKRGWSSLFIRADTAVAAAAERLNVAKGDILDTNEKNIAVRQALAETQAIAETKKYLADEGVNMSAFEGERSKTPLSKNVILVKNLPFNCTLDDLTDLFGKKGTLGRTAMPPNKALAIIEFIHAQEARLTFRQLAYKKFKHAPLYLEWAPRNIFAGTDPTSNEANAGTNKQTGRTVQEEIKELPKKIRSTEALLKENEENDIYSSSETKSVYIKNLNFETTEKDLWKAFRGAENLKNVTVARKRNAKYDKKAKDGDEAKTHLSMGYGFLEFSSEKDAKRAVERFQDVVVDGHRLLLKLSNRAASGSKGETRGRKTSKSGSNAEISSKLMVRNVAFQATRNELRELFGSYGQLKKLRLPRKFDGTHRGFCFVEYLTEQEAKGAKDALSNTHMYGRHLVIEWAKKDESLEELRKRTVDQYVAANSAAERGRAAAHPSRRGEKLTAKTFKKTKRRKL